jgi:hypothetical protein
MIDSKQFIEMLEEIGCDHRAYSGCGMHGKQCVGVVTDDVFNLGVSLGLVMADRGYPNGLAADTWYDSMGLDTVVYWPALVWPEDDEDDNEEE